jgi:hypothetical protein
VKNNETLVYGIGGLVALILLYTCWEYIIIALAGYGALYLYADYEKNSKPGKRRR